MVDESSPAPDPSAPAPDWDGLSVSQLKAALRERGVTTDDCFERADLLA